MSYAAAPAARHCKTVASFRRLVYQHVETRKKARKGGTRNETRFLSANETNSQENRDDSRPLPARNVLSQENGRKPHSNRSIERTEDTDDRDLLHLHSAIAQNKCAGIKNAHAQDHPADLAAGKTQRLFRNENRRRDQHSAGQTDHPHGLHRADARDDANSKQPEQQSEAHSGEDGPADSAVAPLRRRRIIFIGSFFSASDDHDTYQRANDSGDSHTAQPLAGQP